MVEKKLKKRKQRAKLANVGLRALEDRMIEIAIRELNCGDEKREKRMFDACLPYVFPRRKEEDQLGNTGINIVFGNYDKTA